MVLCVSTRVSVFQCQILTCGHLTLIFYSADTINKLTRVYIKHVFYWMSSYKPCSHEGDFKEKQANKKAELNKPVDGNKTHCTLPARM